MRRRENLTTDLTDYLSRLQACISSLDVAEIRQMLELLITSMENGSRIYIFGNGGSAATASHLACDLNKGVGYGRKEKFKVTCLSDNIGILTAYANDVGYESVFVEQIRGILHPEDLVMGISGSGNSPNVLAAIAYANECGVTTIGLTGYDGGKLRKLAKYSCNANINDMQISEDVHMILSHLIMATVVKYCSNNI